MNLSASSSVATFFHSVRSGGVRKYASGDLSQSLNLVSSASAHAASANPARTEIDFFTGPPIKLLEDGFYTAVARQMPAARPLKGAVLGAVGLDQGVAAPRDPGERQGPVGSAGAPRLDLFPQGPQHLLHLALHALHPLFYVENDLHPREIDAQVTGQGEDDLEAFDGVRVVEPRVALGPRGPQQPLPLVHPEGLGMDSVPLGDRADPKDPGSVFLPGLHRTFRGSTGMG